MVGGRSTAEFYALKTCAEARGDAESTLDRLGELPAGESRLSYASPPSAPRHSELSTYEWTSKLDCSSILRVRR